MHVIPFFGVHRQYNNLREEILDITDIVYSTGRVLDGEYTREFEKQIAKRTHRTYALAVNSGTQALIFSLYATVNHTPYAVLIPTVSFVATINSVLVNNFTPVFCDIDHKGLIDLDSYEHKLDASVGAVMYVNLFGNCVNYDRFRIQTEFFNDKLKIVEDAAQSFGASYKGIPSGKMGDVSVLSFDPTKNLNNYGSGGMILTDDYDIFLTCRALRDNGKPSHDSAGTNSKMSEADCAQLLVKLKYFDAWQQRRTDIANYYIDQLYPYCDILTANQGVQHSWHKFVIRTNARNSLMHQLSLAGIESKIHYEHALYDMGVGFNYIDYSRDLYTESAAFTRECLSLPIYPEMSDGEVEAVAAVVKNYLSN
jgi:UDP-2-acetamido-2-deoxy-ribo-hexuluronate aminotransferase